ncbi:MAG TPA: mercury(II) reductase [Thermodesulfobacteriota bacterium]|nr:mercury(II) reductase [Thermodesulfobacteriota bacterium]
MGKQNTVNTVLKVDGMTCSHCDKSVEATLKKIKGVVGAKANYKEAKAEVKYIEGETSIQEIIDTFNKHRHYSASLPEAENKPQDEKVIPFAKEKNKVDFDLIVLGGGSAAFAAAIRASDLGAKVAIAEEDVIGGTCLNRGCVPSKFLIKAAELYHMPKRNGYEGVETHQGKVDFAKLISQKDIMLDEFRQMKYWDVLEAYPDITFFHEKAYFVSKKEVRIGDKNYRSERFIVATGSSPWIPPIEGIDQVDYLTSTTTLELKELPKSIIVLGASAVGLEFAQMYAHFGSKVTVLEVLPRLLPGEEEEISDTLKRYLEEEGIEIYTEANVLSASSNGRTKKIIAEIKGRKIEFEGEVLLVATGRRPNSAGLGLEKVGIKVDKKGGIIVDDEMKTSVAHVWAAGDVVSGVPMLVTIAARAGSIAAENALTGNHKKIDYPSVPYAVFTTPEVAGVGLGEREARDKGYRVKVGYLDFKHVPKAAIIQDTRGLMKMIVEEETNRILGVRMVAPHAADIIQKAALFVKYGMTIQDVLDTIDVYPTLSESIKLCAQSFDKDVTKLSCCAD